MSKSPLPTKKVVKVQGMDFPSAIKSVMDGKTIRRLDWEEGYFGFRFGEYLSLHKPDGGVDQWIISDGDMFANDWVVA